jgi:hypothetical protein
MAAGLLLKEICQKDGEIFGYFLIKHLFYFTQLSKRALMQVF